jgi:hypothetical protein
MSGRAATAPLRPRAAPPCWSRVAPELARAERRCSTKHQHRPPSCLLPSRGAHRRRSFFPDATPVSLRLPCRFVVVPPGASPFTTQLAVPPPSGRSRPRSASVPLGRRSRAPSTLRVSMGQAFLAVVVGPHAGHTAAVQVGHVPLCASGPSGNRPIGLRFVLLFFNYIQILANFKIFVGFV